MKIKNIVFRYQTSCRKQPEVLTFDTLKKFDEFTFSCQIFYLVRIEIFYSYKILKKEEWRTQQSSRKFLDFTTYRNWIENSVYDIEPTPQWYYIAVFHNLNETHRPTTNVGIFDMPETAEHKIREWIELYSYKREEFTIDKYPLNQLQVLTV